MSVSDDCQTMVRKRYEWAQANGWPIVGGKMTDIITMYQCPYCYALTLLPEGHNEVHRYSQ